MTNQSLFEIISINSPDRLEQTLANGNHDYILAILLCLEGSFDICLRGNLHSIHPDSLLFLHRDAFGYISNISGTKLSAKIALASQQFLNSLNFDINVISSISFTPERPPIIRLTPGNKELSSRYFNLMELNLVENNQPVYRNSISRNLFAALIYQILQFGAENQAIDSSSTATGRVSRRHSYVRTFLQLLHENYTAQRNVAFYAEKMFMSPKYLSTIVKEITGHSAAEWIDHVVIIEAKNLLRYSGLNIQQVAYRLNFTSQSSFGKYFKHFTGLSPTEFQKS